MKIFSELVVMHGDHPMPDEEAFCPSFWGADDFDADGDYYADGLDGRWTDLRLTKRGPDGDSILRVGTLREQRPYDPGIQEVADLRRFLDYHRAGRYAHDAPPAGLERLAVTSLAIETPDLADYREFLETVAGFLEHTGGALVSPWVGDAAAFRAEFLADG